MNLNLIGVFKIIAEPMFHVYPFKRGRCKQQCTEWKDQGNGQ